MDYAHDSRDDNGSGGQEAKAEHAEASPERERLAGSRVDAS